MLTMPPPADTTELVAGLIALDEQAVAELLDRYWERAYRLAVQLTGEPNTAEDVAQETFVAVVRQIGRLKDPSAFQGWLFRILENTAKKQHRARSRREAREERAREARTPLPSGNPAERAEQEEERELVRAHLLRLSPKLRHTLALRFLEGMSLKDVAKTLGIPAKTVSSRIRLGLESLHDSLRPALSLSVAALPAYLLKAMSVGAPSAPQVGLLIAAARSVPLAPAPADVLRLAAGSSRRLPFGVLVAVLILGAIAALQSLLPGVGGDVPKESPNSAPVQNDLAAAPSEPPPTERETPSVQLQHTRGDSTPTPGGRATPPRIPATPTKPTQAAKAVPTDATIRLTVRDETGLPLSNVRCQVHYAKDDGWSGAAQGKFTLDAAGQALLTGLRPSQRIAVQLYWLPSHAPGMDTPGVGFQLLADPPVVLSAGETRNVDWVAKAQRPLDGFVLGVAHDARVSVAVSYQVARPRYELTNRVPLSSSSFRIWIGPGVTDVVVSTADGRSARWTPEPTSSGASSYTFDLDSFRSVAEGTVVSADTGEPIAGARISPAKGGNRFCVTDPMGGFQLKLADPCDLLKVEAEGFVSAEVPVQRTGDRLSTGGRIALDVAGSVMVTIVGANGEEPREDCSVSILGEWRFVDTKTHRIRVRGLIPGRHALEVFADKRSIETDVEIKAGRETTIEVRLPARASDR